MASCQSKHVPLPLSLFPFAYSGHQQYGHKHFPSYANLAVVAEISSGTQRSVIRAVHQDVLPSGTVHSGQRFAALIFGKAANATTARHVLYLMVYE